MEPTHPGRTSKSFCQLNALDHACQVSILGITEVYDASPSPSFSPPLEPYKRRRLAGCSDGSTSCEPPGTDAAAAGEQAGSRAVAEPGERLLQQQQQHQGRGLQQLQGGEAAPKGVNVDTLVIFPGDQFEAAQRFANSLRSSNDWLTGVYGQGATVSNLQLESERWGARMPWVGRTGPCVCGCRVGDGKGVAISTGCRLSAVSDHLHHTSVSFLRYMPCCPLPAPSNIHLPKTDCPGGRQARQARLPAPRALPSCHQARAPLMCRAPGVATA